MKEIVEENPSTALGLVLALTGVNGSNQFDKITKTKTVESCLAKLDGAETEKYIKHLQREMSDEGNRDKRYSLIYWRKSSRIYLSSRFLSLEDHRLWIADQQVAIIKRISIESDTIIQLVLDWLAFHAFFGVDKLPGVVPHTAVCYVAFV